MTVNGMELLAITKIIMHTAQDTAATDGLLYQLRRSHHQMWSGMVNIIGEESAMELLAGKVYLHYATLTVRTERMIE
jgi:hypothetical protein